MVNKQKVRSGLACKLAWILFHFHCFRFE